MSGGAFNYQYRKIKEMADDLRRIIGGEYEEVDGSTYVAGANCYDGDGAFYLDATPHGKEAVAAVALVLDVAARMAKAVEWWASGEIGEGEAIDDMNAALVDAVRVFAILYPEEYADQTGIKEDASGESVS